MNTVLERSTLETTEQQMHNAMINERYRKLLDAVEDQFASATAPVEQATPVMEQTPVVTEYTPSAIASSVFTVEKLERMELGAPAREIAPAKPQAVVAAKTHVVAHYSLTPLAKVVMAVFTLIVIAMLALIGVNSRTMQQKSVRIRNLEEKREQLVQEYDELQRRLEELQTDESIIERATEAGLVS